jgi:hypothetical protein
MTAPGPGVFAVPGSASATRGGRGGGAAGCGRGATRGGYGGS